MKKIFITFLTFVLYFNSFTLAHASGLNGWTLSNPIAQGASVLYNGAKNVLINGKNVAKTSTALVTPVAKDVAKLLGKGVAGVALSVAVEQLIGAVDWVLDPANSSIRYTVDPSCTVDSCNPKPSEQYLWNYSGNHFSISSSASSICLSILNIFKTGSNSQQFDKISVKSTLTTQIECYITSTNKPQFNGSVLATRISNPAYNPNAEPSEKEEKSIPLDVVAAQVISNAENGDTNAQVATTAAAADIVAEAETDNTKARPIVNQLEANSKTETDESASAESKPKDPAKPESGTDFSLQFPVFCGWAPTICEAATTVISFPTTLTNWWDTATKSISDAWVTAKDWATTEKDKDQKDTEVEILDDAVPNIDKGLFQASGQCPPDFSYPFPLPMGGSYKITYSYATACTWFSKIYYVVVLVASIIGLKIVTGADGNKDG